MLHDPDRAEGGQEAFCFHPRQDEAPRQDHRPRGAREFRPLQRPPRRLAESRDLCRRKTGKKLNRERAGMPASSMAEEKANGTRSAPGTAAQTSASATSRRQTLVKHLQLTFLVWKSLVDHLRICRWLFMQYHMQFVIMFYIMFCYYAAWLVIMFSVQLYNSIVLVYIIA